MYVNSDYENKSSLRARYPLDDMSVRGTDYVCTSLTKKNCIFFPLPFTSICDLEKIFFFFGRFVIWRIANDVCTCIARCLGDETAL